MKIDEAKQHQTREAVVEQSKEVKTNGARICIPCNISNYIRGGKFLLKTPQEACPKCRTTTYPDSDEVKLMLNHMLDLIKYPPDPEPVQCSQPVESTPTQPFSGDKYKRRIHPVTGTPGDPIIVDVYSVIKAFQVTSAGLQHCLKKILCPGRRGKADTLKDLNEAKDALQRAIEQEQEELQTGKLSLPDETESMRRWLDAMGIKAEDLAAKTQKTMQDIDERHV